MSPGIIAGKGRAFLRDRKGSAAAEVAMSASVIIAIAVAASDLGVVLRGDAALEAAARDAARVLSLAPLDAAGTPTAESLALAETVVSERLLRAGLTPQAVIAPQGAACSADSALCAKVEAVAGSVAILGEERRLVTVWTAASAPTRFMDVFFPEVAGGAGKVSMTASLSQMHFR